MEQIKIKEIKYELDDSTAVKKGFKIPESKLVPEKYWGYILNNKEFLITGDIITEVK